MKRIKLFILFIILSIVVHSQSINNLCGSAVVSSQTGGCVGGSIIVGDADNIAGCAGCQNANCNQHKDVWYTFVSTGNTFEFTLTGGTLINGEITLISATGPCAGLVLINSSCGTLPFSGLFSGLSIGTTYYVMVSAPSNQTGTFTLCTTVSIPLGIDCNTATQICNNSPFVGNSTGFGTQELSVTNRGCLSTEHQASWYIFQIQTSGTLNMTIVPGVGVDYDYALWGPNSACSPTTSPIRCSFASGFITNSNTGSYNTGFGVLGTESSDGTAGTLDGWSSTLNVIAGQTYILLIDNFTSNSTFFNLNWGGTASLSCTPLPVELISFSGEQKNSYNQINWSTITENNNNFFILEKSYDAINFEEISKINGFGNSNDIKKIHI